MKVDDRQRYLMIAEAAYFRAQQRNFSAGHEVEDWLDAERQVDEMLGNLRAVPMQAELQSAAEAKPVSRQRRTKQAAPAKVAATTPAAGAVKPARGRRTKAAEPSPAPVTKPRDRRKATSEAKQTLKNPDFMADMVTGLGSGEEALRTGMGDAGIGLGAEQPAMQPGAGAAGTTAGAGAGAEAEAKPKRGRRPKAAAAETSATTAPRRPGRPRKTLH
jgi:hypothetical protein